MRTIDDLRPAQDRAVTRFYEHDAVQAVMPMGSGKTAAAMTAVWELINDGGIRSALVLAPKRVGQLVWMEEHKLWEHLQDLRIQHVVGTPQKRLAKLMEGGFDIKVVGVDSTQWLVDWLKKLPDDDALFDLLIIDESSRFKNPRGKRGRALQTIAHRFKAVWELTGTPRPNGYQDQYRPMQLLTSGRLWHRSYDKWLQERFMPTDYNGYNWTIRPEWHQRTKDEIARYSFTVSDEDLPYLEPITPVFHWVDLPPSAQRTYDEMERKLFAQFVDLKDKDKRAAILAANAAVASGKLAQAAQGFMYDEEGMVTILHEEKIGMLEDLVEGVDSEPMLIGYWFKEDLATIREKYPNLPYLGGGVKDAEVASHEKAWNERKLPLLGLHPASAGHGLNLQYGGSQLTWYCLPWSAELYDQTLKRFHRPGQTRRCFAHYILARNTVDEIKYARIIEKVSDQEAFRNYLEKI